VTGDTPSTRLVCPWLCFVHLMVACSTYLMHGIRCVLVVCCVVLCWLCAVLCCVQGW